MKKFVKCFAILAFALCFFGCKNNVNNVFNASIIEVFYTDLDAVINADTLDSLTRITDIHDDADYKLVCNFNEPDLNVVKLIQQTEEGREYPFIISPTYTGQISSWTDGGWIINTTHDTVLTFYLEDADGNRSAPFRLNLKFWAD